MSDAAAPDDPPARGRPHQRVVVVGASLGGLRVAESLRASGYAGSLVVVGAEPWLPYNRPPLSKEALTGGLDHAALEFRRRPSVEDVDWRLGVAAVSADLSARTLTLADETVLGWDGLVAASGLRSWRLPVPGPVAGRHALRTVDDAQRLRGHLVPGARVVVVGCGFVGCEVAATARALGCDVVVTGLDDLPLERAVGPMLAGELRRRLEARGLRFRLGVGIDRYLGAESATGVRLSDGVELPADVVVEAVGSRCNVEWLDGNDLDLSDGVLTDAALRALRRDGTPVDGVHAVGDVARFPNVAYDEVPRRVEHWSMPTDTARRAGPVLAAWLAGDPEGHAAALARPFVPVPSFWSDLFDLRLQSFGMPHLGEESHVLEGDLDGAVVVGYTRDGALVGVVGVDATKQAMAYRGRVGEVMVPGSGRV